MIAAWRDRPAIRFSLAAGIALLAALACGTDPAEPGGCCGDGGAILFIGNSLTYTNDLPGMVAGLSAAAGDEPPVRLHAITAQLRPHFLFNTLNTIAGLVRIDPAQAERMTVRLSELLRLVIDRTDTLDVSLADELRLIEAYIAIERVRYGERLAVHMHVDPDVMDARIPSLGIQPLVENAIRHGIAPASLRGTVEVRARRCGKTLRIEIRDDGAGLRGGAESIREGVGLGNTRARLQQFFGDAGRLEIAAASPRGTIVTMELPYATASPDRR